MCSYREAAGSRGNPITITKVGTTPRRKEFVGEERRNLGCRGDSSRPRALTQLSDYLWNDFNGAVDFRFGVEPAKGKTEAAAGTVAIRIHCA